jgi:hypothetical protein
MNQGTQMAANRFRTGITVLGGRFAPYGGGMPFAVWPMIIQT